MHEMFGGKNINTIPVVASMFPNRHYKQHALFLRFCPGYVVQKLACCHIHNLSGASARPVAGAVKARSMAQGSVCWATIRCSDFNGDVSGAVVDFVV
jgi:hypothetical protein